MLWWFHYDPLSTDPVDSTAVQTLEQLVFSDVASRDMAYTQLQAATPAQQYAVKLLLQQLLRRTLLLPQGVPNHNPSYVATLAEIGAVYACSINPALRAQITEPQVYLELLSAGLPGLLGIWDDAAQAPPVEIEQRWQLLREATAQAAAKVDPWLHERCQIIHTMIHAAEATPAQLAGGVVAFQQVADYALKLNHIGLWVFLHDMLTMAAGRSQGTVGRNARMPAPKPSRGRQPGLPVYPLALLQLQLAVQAHIVLWLVAHPDSAGSYSWLHTVIEQRRQEIRHALRAHLAAICHQTEDTQEHIWLRDKPTRNPLLDNIGEPCFPTRTPVSVFVRTYQRTQPTATDEAHFLGQCLTACLKAGYEPGVLATLKIIAAAPNGDDWVGLNAQLEQLRSSLQQTVTALANCPLELGSDEDVEFELVLAGNKYQVSIRRTGVTIRLPILVDAVQRAIDQRSVTG